jgi:hypothetical protein
MIMKKAKKPRKPPLRKRVWWPWIDLFVRRAVTLGLPLLAEWIKKHLGP